MNEAPQSGFDPVAFRDAFWKRSYGSIAVDEAECIHELIQKHKPEGFLEIGTASGFSGGLICWSLEMAGGKRFRTVDFDNTFFGEKNTENGFLIPKIYTNSKVSVRRDTHRISIDVADDNDGFEMAFIDANHMHPWPTLDTIALLPLMNGEKIIIHHDYNLFKKQRRAIGLGPKFLFDQMPERVRNRFDANEGNLFYLHFDDEPRAYSEALANSLLLPWTIRGDAFSATEGVMKGAEARFRRLIETHYDPVLLTAFDEGLSRLREIVGMRQQINRQVNQL